MKWNESPQGNGFPKKKKKREKMFSNGFIETSACHVDSAKQVFLLTKRRRKEKRKYQMDHNCCKTTNKNNF